MTEAEKLFQQFLSEKSDEPSEGSMSNDGLLDDYLAQSQPEIVEEGVIEPSGVSGGTVEEQMMAAESEVPTLDAYGSPIMPPPLPPEIEQDPEFQEKLAAASEVFLTMLSGMTLGAGGQVRGTIAGLTEEILSGEFGTPEAARYIQQKAMETGAKYTSMPESELGQEYLQAVSEPLSSIPAYIPAMGSAGTISAALSGARQAVRAGGAPEVAQMTGQAVREVVPTAIDVAVPQPVQSVGRSLAKTAQQGSELAVTGYDFARGRGKSQDIYQSLAKVPDSADVVEFQLINDRVVKDPLATTALAQGWDPAVLGSIKTSSNKDKFEMLRMIGELEEGKIRAEYAALNRPEAVLGSSMLERVKFLDKKNLESGKKIGQIARTKLKNQQINIDPAVGKLLQDLEEIKVKIVLGNEKGFLRNPTVSFDGSQLQADRSSQRLIKDVLKYLNNVDSTDSLSVHELKQFLDTSLEYGKKASNPITAKTDRILKGFRRNLSDSLNEINKDYKAENNKFSETRRALEQIQDAVGKKVDFDSPRAKDAFGTALRKVLSNYGTRNNIIDAIDVAESISRKYGMDVKDNLIKQLIFVNELDRMFGSVAPSSFKGQIQQAMKTGLDLARSSSAEKAYSMVDAAVGAGAKVMKKEINEENAILAMKKVLKRPSTKQTKTDLVDK